VYLYTNLDLCRQIELGCTSRIDFNSLNAFIYQLGDNLRINFKAPFVCVVYFNTLSYYRIPIFALISSLDDVGIKKKLKIVID